LGIHLPCVQYILFDLIVMVLVLLQLEVHLFVYNIDTLLTRVPNIFRVQSINKNNLILVLRLHFLQRVQGRLDKVFLQS
jgi:hypothetical protein